MFPTPVDPSKGGGSSRSGDRINEIPSLQGMARAGKWPTPHGFSKDGRSNGPSGNELGRAVNQNEAQPSGSLNPPWVEWLMNWAPGWTSLEPLPPEHFEQWLTPGWWHSEPAGVPRVYRGVPDRVSRLKAIGNGQVAACVAMAWRLLTRDG